MTYTPGRCEISLRANDLGKSAEPLLVRFEHCVERVLLCSDKLCRGFLFPQSGLEIGVGFPYFAHCGIARAGEFVLRAVHFRLGHFHFVAPSKSIEDRNTDRQINSVSLTIIPKVI